LDTLSLRVFSPLATRKVNAFKTAGINRFVVGANFSLVDAQLVLNGSPVTSENRSHITEDSVYVYGAFSDLTEANLVVLKDSFVDTLKTRITPKDKAFPLRVMSDKKRGMLTPIDTLSYSVNGKITALDSAFILVKNAVDSSFVAFDLTYLGANQFSIVPKTNIEKGVVVFKKGAMNCGSTMNMDSTGFAFQYGALEDFGVLDAVLNDFSGSFILQLKRGNELVSERTVSGGTTVHYEYLEPAEYTFVLIEDLDGNGKWTTGNLIQGIQPEMVYRFSQVTKVRANWDVSVELRP
jgi:hypothetical protein